MSDRTAIALSFRKALRACTTCELSAGCNGPVPWRGDMQPTYAVLGEAPGKTEDKEGQPFVGDSGHILEHWLKKVGFNPKDMAFLNSVQCLPHGTPKPEHVDACGPWLRGQLEFIRPKVLITVGVVAFEALRRTKWPKLRDVHGKPMVHPVYDFRVFSTWHPAAYLRGRNVAYEQKILADLEKVKGWDGLGLDECYIDKCGGEIYNYDPWKIGLCHRHSVRQGILFPEDVG